MFRPDEFLPSRPALPAERAAPTRQYFAAHAAPVPPPDAPLPLPIGWEQMALDERVRCIGEW